MTQTKKRILAACAFVAIPAILAAAVSMLAVAATEGSKSLSLFTPDKGNFRILVNGQQMGKEEFDISQSGGDWVAKGTSVSYTHQMCIRDRDEHDWM